MKISIRIELEGKNAERFLKLKERIGVRSNSELLRVLIEKAARNEGVV